MDREALNTVKNELKGFIDAVNLTDHKLSYACLVPAYKNDRNSPLVLQLYGGWMDSYPCSESISIMVDYLFQNSDVETRKKIYRIDIYNKDGDCQCVSDEFILIGEPPLLYC